MQKIVIVLLLVIIIVLLFPKPKPTTQPKVVLKPLEKYTYPALRAYAPNASITIDKEIKKNDDFTSYLFFLTTTQGKKVSGLMNVPATAGAHPIALLIRGFVDPANYTTGTGTQHLGEYLATKGFVTLAPDFLGYGQSDKPSPDAFEDRFLTYTTVIDLLATVKKPINGIATNPAKIGIWGHSNGGQIALSVAEIMGHQFPTVVWAPVSKPFPYSILYYTDEFDDKGKALRKVLAQFETLYDVEKYSLTNYFDWINAPIQVHQGEADEAVPVAWSDALVQTLKDKKKDVEYFTYPATNHNFQSDLWSLAASRTAAFFTKDFQP